MPNNKTVTGTVFSMHTEFMSDLICNGICFQAFFVQVKVKYLKGIPRRKRVLKSQPMNGVSFQLVFN